MIKRNVRGCQYTKTYSKQWGEEQEFYLCRSLLREVAYQPRITQIELNEALHYNFLFHLGWSEFASFHFAIVGGLFVFKFATLSYFIVYLLSHSPMFMNSKRYGIYDAFVLRRNTRKRWDISKLYTPLILAMWNE